MRAINKRLLGEAISCVLAATLANFLWQLCFDNNWSEALKISYFQGFSIFYFAWRVS